MSSDTMTTANNTATTTTSTTTSQMNELTTYLTLNDVIFPHHSNINNNDTTNNKASSPDDEASEFDEESTVCYSSRSFTTDMKNEIHDALNANTYDSDLNENNIIQNLSVNDTSKEDYTATFPTQSPQHLNALSAASELYAANRNDVSSDKDSNTNLNSPSTSSPAVAAVLLPQYECVKFIPKSGESKPKSHLNTTVITTTTTTTKVTDDDDDDDEDTGSNVLTSVGEKNSLIS